jgi:hypothetical protein
MPRGLTRKGESGWSTKGKLDLGRVRKVACKR